MKTSIATLVCFFSLFIIHAQDVKWSYVHDGPLHMDDEAGFSTFGHDGKIYGAGTLNQGTDSTGDAYAVRLDTQGNELWSYTYNGTGNGNDAMFTGIVGSDGNLYFVGQTQSLISRDILIISLDTNGNERWVRTFDGPDSQEDLPGYILSEDAAGNIYVAVNSQDSVGTHDMGVISYTSSGNFRFSYMYDGPAHGDDLTYAVYVGPDNNVYFGGGSEGVGTNYDYTVISIDTSGNQRWVYRYNNPSTGYDFAYYGMAFDDHGNIYTCGDIEANGNGQDLAVIRLHMQNGAENWNYILNGTGNFDDIAHYLLIGPDHNLYVCGVTNSAYTNYDGIVLSFDSTGNQRWMYTINEQDSTKENISMLTLGGDGNLYFDGVANDSDNVRDWMIGALDMNGNEKWVTLYSGTGNGQDEGRAVYQMPDGEIVSSGFTTNSNGRDFTIIGMCNHPSAGFSVSADTICAGTAITLSNSSTEAFNYRWLDNGNFFDYHQNTTFSTLTPGAHSLQLVAMSGGCMDTASANVFIDSIPSVSLNLSFSTACMNWNPVSLSGGMPLGGVYSGNAVSGGMFDPASLSPGNTDIIYMYVASNGCSSEDTASVYVDSCLGMNDPNDATAVSIYPNPFHDMATFTISDLDDAAEIILFDVNGKIVHSQIVPPHTTTVDLNRVDLANGMYFFNVFSNEKLISRGKVAIQ